MLLANAEERLQRVAAGDAAELLRAVVFEALLWLHLDGFDYRLGRLPTAAHVVDKGRAAAALNLIRLLAHSPQGREALRDLGLEPLGEQSERPGG